MNRHRAGGLLSRVLPSAGLTLVAIVATFGAGRAWRDFAAMGDLADAGYSADESLPAPDPLPSPPARREAVDRALALKCMTSAASVDRAMLALHGAVEGPFADAAGPLSNALADVGRALAANPSNTEAWLTGYRVVETGRSLGLGSRILPHGQDAAATSKAFLDGALRTNPNGVEVQREMAGMLMAAGDRKGAWDHYQRAMRLSTDPIRLAHRMIDAGYAPGEVSAIVPSAADPQYELGRLLEAAGESALAESAYRRAASLDPARWETWRALSALDEAAGQHARALADARAALPLLRRLRPQARAEILQCAAIAARGAGDAEAAKGYAKQAMEEDPEHLFAAHLAATLCDETGDLAEAIRIWKSLIDTHAKDPYVVEGLATFQRSLGRCYEKLDMVARAREHYQAALAVSPSDTVSRQALERLARRR